MYVGYYTNKTSSTQMIDLNLVYRMYVWHWLTNSAHDTGVVSEGDREIAHRNWWCNFCPATAWIKPSIGHPKPAIGKASVSAATMTDILESNRRTQSQPIAGSTWRLPKQVCVRCCVQYQAHNLLNCAAGIHLLVAIG
jgi:hypothetical protein